MLRLHQVPFWAVRRLRLWTARNPVLESVLGRPDDQDHDLGDN